MWLVGAGKNGVSALELQPHLEVSDQTAWHMGHRLREAMTREPMVALLKDTIEADETWVGGDPKNRHANRRNAKSRQGFTEKVP